MSRPSLARTGAAPLSLLLSSMLLSTTALAQSLPASPTQAPALALDPVDVTARPDTQGYQVRIDGGLQGGATRTSTPLKDMPQSVAVIPRQVIEEQGLQDRADALRNVAGVTVNTPLNFDGSGTSDKVRGFSPQFYRDGLISFFDAGDRDSLVGVERYEVIKGPSGSLFGGGLGGSFGGEINTVSSLPQRTNSYAAGIRVGSYGTIRPFLDVNQVLSADGHWSARIQAEYDQNRSTVDNYSARRNTIFPQLQYKDDRTTITLQYLHTERRALDYAGLPAYGTVTGPVRVGFSTNVTGTDTPKSVTTRDAGTLLAEHKINDVFTVRLAARWSTSNLEEPATFAFGAAPLKGTVATFNRFYGILYQDLNDFTILPSIEARFATGPVRHTVLAGIEASTVSDVGNVTFTPTTPIDLLRPSYGVYRQSPRTTLGQGNRYITNAGFVQDQLDYDRFHLQVALRGTGIDATYRNRDTGARYPTTDTRVDPRVGLAIDVLPGISVFAGYGTGVRVNQNLRPVVVTQKLKPEEGDQLEVGVKLDLAAGLSGTLALFDIHRSNVTVADPAVPFNSIQTGEQRSRGFDADLVWQPTPRLSFLLAYAYLDAQVTKDTTYAVGTRLPLVPAHSGRFWTAYRFAVPVLGDVVAGAGLYASSRQAVDISNAAFTPGFVTADAALTWQRGPLKLQVQAQNLFDRKYYVPFGYLGGAVTQAERRTGYVTASVRF